MISDERPETNNSLESKEGSEPSKLNERWGVSVILAVTLAFTFLEAVAVEERFLLPTSEAVEALSTDDELASEDMVKGRYVVQCRACSSFS